MSKLEIEDKRNPKIAEAGMHDLLVPGQVFEAVGGKLYLKTQNGAIILPCKKEDDPFLMLTGYPPPIKFLKARLVIEGEE